MSLIWLAAVIVTAIIEGVTVGLVSIWFTAGALAALIVSLFWDSVIGQLLVFLVVSGLAMALLRPLARKYLTPKKVATNADRTVGQRVLVTEEIDGLRGTGAVKVRDLVWTAHSADDRVIPVGTIVVVERIEGAHVIVSPADNGKES